MTYFIDGIQFNNFMQKDFPSAECLRSVLDFTTVFRDKTFNGFELHIFTNIDFDADKNLDLNGVRVDLFDPVSFVVVDSCQFTDVKFLSESCFVQFKELVEKLCLVGSRIPICPKCSAHMIRRVNRVNGNEFFGCSAFPSCPKGTTLVRKYPLMLEKVYKKSLQNSLVSGLEVEYTDLVSDEDCISTKEYPDLEYSFEKFNRVQSTILKLALPAKDCNVILGTSTSSGKTVCSEFFIVEALFEKKQVIYVSPLKSLSMEKFTDWSTKVFKDYKVIMLTGDTLWSKIEREKQLREAEKADIIIMTSELLDSLTRNVDRSYTWFQSIGLIILDEIHIITSSSRGSCVEVGLMRFSKIAPEVKILGLSATLSNIDHFKIWFSTLNGKDTEIVNSDWRPTKLHWRFIEYSGILKYKDQQRQKIEKACEILVANREDKTLCFVHDKISGRLLVRRLKTLGVEAEFHSADLSLSERMRIEKAFDEDLNVLVATSTLAWGKNTSAKNVIIVGVTRGLREVDVLDIIQEAGRAGRVGRAEEGFCYLICDNIKKWEKLLANSRPVVSTLLNEHTLGFHILGSIKTGTIQNFETLKSWFVDSLAAVQDKWDTNIVERSLRLLDRCKMLEKRSGDFLLTALGDISASLYFMPQDVYHWYLEFAKIDRQNLWKNDLVLSWALGSVPSQDFGYVPKDSQARVSEYTRALKLLGFSGVKDSLKSCDLYDLLTGNNVSFTVRNFRQDAERITSALLWINRVCGWKKDDFFNKLAVRLKYGVSFELVDLCCLPGVGAAKAKLLYAAGIKNVEFLVEENRNVLCRILGSVSASNLIRGRRLIKRGSKSAVFD